MRTVCRGTSLIRNHPSPEIHPTALGVVLLSGPTGLLFLMSEVPLVWVGPVLLEPAPLKESKAVRVVIRE